MSAEAVGLLFVHGTLHLEYDRSKQEIDCKESEDRYDDDVENRPRHCGLCRHHAPVLGNRPRSIVALGMVASVHRDECWRRAYLPYAETMLESVVEVSFEKRKSSLRSEGIAVRSDASGCLAGSSCPRKHSVVW